MAEESQNSNEKFDIKIVHDKFQASLIDEDDIDLELYLESFRELSKFFALLGSIFKFVNDDLQEKMDHLYSLQTSEQYKRVKTMIQHEKDKGLLEQRDFVSGSRTLLRIHRGLDFIRLFLKKLYELDHSENTSPICKEAYNQTLANYHGFFIRQGAKLAMSLALPTKQDLLITVCGNEEDIQRAIELLPDTLSVSNKVYDLVENLYTIHDLHRLP
ncbi:hypothetical protein ABEB36_011776 [Hypothenemus hampei]|uniref:Glycolipid transfer protein domain-containing protein n=1 Tax=Hypothenemus hampei TaxID=57062 RepID=A0ABD1EBN6_HYPHA